MKCPGLLVLLRFLGFYNKSKTTQVYYLWSRERRTATKRDVEQQKLSDGDVGEHRTLPIGHTLTIHQHQVLQGEKDLPVPVEESAKVTLPTILDCNERVSNDFLYLLWENFSQQSLPSLEAEERKKALGFLIKAAFQASLGLVKELVESWCGCEFHQ